MHERRKLLTGSINVFLGSNLAIWYKPLVNSVILPAHGQTSNLFPSGVFVNRFNGPEELERLCLTFRIENGIGFINAKARMPDDCYEEGNIEFTLSQLAPPFQINFTKDCNGNEIDPINFVQIVGYSEVKVDFQLIQGKLDPINEAFPGECNLGELSCS